MMTLSRCLRLICLYSCILAQFGVISSCARPQVKNLEKFQQAPYVVLVSIDGFRHDYASLHSSKELLDMQARGLAAKSLRPVFPSKTFPNHYSIITGRYAEDHGIVSNEFYDKANGESYSISDRHSVMDGKWYLGEPVWILAQKQGMSSASYYWVGSDAKIQGLSPNYYFSYDSKVENAKRVNQVLAWLQLPIEKRPHFITLYFSIVDSAGHDAGPNSQQVKNAIQAVDEEIARLRQGIKSFALPVNLIVVSDHGMQDIDADHVIRLPELVDQRPYLLSGQGSFAMLYASGEQEKKDIERAYVELKKIKHLNVWKKNEVPAHFHFKNSSRIGDLVLSPEAPYYMLTHSSKKIVHGGSHGFDPYKYKSMHGIFFAEGPNIKPSHLGTIDNIEIYPFICNILGLKTNQPDGSLLSKQILLPFVIPGKAQGLP